MSVDGFDPGTHVERLVLPQTMLDAIFEHARREAPRECCGVGFGVGERVCRVVPLRNLATDNYHYVADPAELVRLLPQARDRGEDVVVIYHSHPSSPPVPSATDLREAYWPGTPYLIVSLAPRQERAFRAWHLIDGRATEIECVVE